MTSKITCCVQQSPTVTHRFTQISPKGKRRHTTRARERRIALLSAPADSANPHRTLLCPVQGSQQLTRAFEIVRVEAFGEQLQIGASRSRAAEGGGPSAARAPYGRRGCPERASAPPVTRPAWNHRTGRHWEAALARGVGHSNICQESRSAGNVSALLPRGDLQHAHRRHALLNQRAQTRRDSRCIEAQTRQLRSPRRKAAKRPGTPAR